MNECGLLVRLTEKLKGHVQFHQEWLSTQHEKVP